MQVIEKVKVVPEGYNGAGMDGYGRRDVNGKANAGLTLGIIGTALGAWALFGNRRSAGVLGTGAGLMGDGSTNINVVGAGMGSAGAPTAFQAWSKSCEDTLALQGGLYQWALTQQSQRFQDRQVIDSEMFGLYKSQIDEEIEIIKSIPNFDFNIPVLGNGNISNGNITLSIPFINKGIMFNQSDLETFRQLLTK